MQLLCTLSATAAVALAASSAPAPSSTSTPQPAVSSYATPLAVPCEEAYLGVFVVPAEGTTGASVTRVMEGSPADAAGFRPGDRIVAIGDRHLAGPDALIGYIEGCEAGDPVEITYFRGEDKGIVELYLGARVEAAEYFDEGATDAFFSSDAFGDVPNAVIRTGIPAEAIDAWVHELPDPTTEINIPHVEITTPEITWVPAEFDFHGDEPEENDLQGRVDEMRERMDVRYEELRARLEEFLEAQDHDREVRERIEDFRRSMEESRRDQEERLEQVREMIREAMVQRTYERSMERIEDRAAAIEERNRPRIASPWVLEDVTPPVIDLSEPRTAEILLRPPVRVRSDRDEPRAATHEEVRALHEDVRALREEIQEIKDLLRGGR